MTVCTIRELLPGAAFSPRVVLGFELGKNDSTQFVRNAGREIARI